MRLLYIAQYICVNAKRPERRLAHRKCHPGPTFVEVLRECGDGGPPGNDRSNEESLPEVP